MRRTWRRRYAVSPAMFPEINWVLRRRSPTTCHSDWTWSRSAPSTLLRMPGAFLNSDPANALQWTIPGSDTHSFRDGGSRELETPCATVGVRSVLRSRFAEKCCSWWSDPRRREQSSVPGGGVDVSVNQPSDAGRFALPRNNQTLPRSESWRPPLLTSPTTRQGRIVAWLRHWLDLQAGSIWADMSMLLPHAGGTVVDIGAGAQPYRSLCRVAFDISQLTSRPASRTSATRCLARSCIPGTRGPWALSQLTSSYARRLLSTFLTRTGSFVRRIGYSSPGGISLGLCPLLRGGTSSPTTSGVSPRPAWLACSRRGASPRCACTHEVGPQRSPARRSWR